MEPTPAEAVDPEAVGPEAWVREALAQQEEHIKRSLSCLEQRFRSHTYRTFGHPDPDGTIANAATWSACTVCGVTETNADYHRRIATQTPIPDVG